MRVGVKGQKNRKGVSLRADFGLGADNVPLPQARECALAYRRMAKHGLNPQKKVPTFGEVARQVYIERVPT